MFLIDCPTPLYTDPWTDPLYQRLVRLYAGHRRAAYYYHMPNNSTFRYRVYNMLRCLEDSGHQYSGTYFVESEIEDLFAALKDIEVLVICRAHYSGRLSELVYRAKSYGVRVLFDIDDLVFDPSYIHTVVDSLDLDDDSSQTWVTWFAEAGRLGAIMRICDAAITTNAHLAQYVKEFADIPVEIIPNFLNREQLTVSQQVYDSKVQHSFKSDGRIHIGYFSGTPTHNKDFDIVSGALHELMSADSRITLRIGGFLELRGAITDLYTRIEFVPLTDFVTLQRVIGEVEINIAPLQDNAFTNCKSELKYFEAAVVGTLTIAAPTFTFRHAIKDGDNGFLSRTWEWGDRLRTTIGSLADGSYAEMAARARAHSLRTYGPDVMSDRVRNVLFGRQHNLVRNKDVCLQQS